MVMLCAVLLSVFIISTNEQMYIFKKCASERG